MSSVCGHLNNVASLLIYAVSNLGCFFSRSRGNVVEKFNDFVERVLVVVPDDDSE